MRTAAVNVLALLTAVACAEPAAVTSATSNVRFEDGLDVVDRQVMTTEVVDATGGCDPTAASAQAARFNSAAATLLPRWEFVACF